MNWQVIIDFWFQQTPPERWFIKDLAFDQTITRMFSEAHEVASKGGYALWRKNLEGRLAEILILDQFSRNIYRNQPRAFAQDSLALILAKEAIKDPMHWSLEKAEKTFLYMPFMHSESMEDHEKAVELFSQPGLESNLDFEFKHKKIIQEFGRYPHRNWILGRQSTPAELEFLKTPGSAF